STGGVGALHCFFLLTERPEYYNLPPAPELPSTRVLPASIAAAATALVYGAIAVAAIQGAARRGFRLRG
ncbi:MAG TPA: 4Fe-4S dicluster domain-containing protein, partial [Chloroflexota bacterium]|nr:4Fe-4S dicluster domain-containing protein [Chloroflexota bacterium]